MPRRSVIKRKKLEKQTGQAHIAVDCPGDEIGLIRSRRGGWKAEFDMIWEQERGFQFNELRMSGDTMELPF